MVWGESHRRDLPWRRTRDPWAVLVSEVMLQQTQVDRVIDRWRAFLEVYPDPASCARAPLGDVLRLWQGLGYPRRARNLHAAAQRLVERRASLALPDAVLPDTLAELLALPGVGGYTARAVLAFAFEQPEAVVDTNIARVLARACGRRLTQREVQAMADAAVDRADPWAWNQTLMDIGATLCRPLSPQCASCPLRRGCAYRGEGDDPARGSAAVSVTQARFEGSDRQARGRVLAAVGREPLPMRDVAAVIASPDDAQRAQRIVDSLVADGLVVVNDTVVMLP